MTKRFISGKTAIVYTLNNGDQYLSSYKMIVAWTKDGVYHVGKHWNYSRTTAKHVRIFTGLDTKTLRALPIEQEDKYWGVENGADAI